MAARRRSSASKSRSSGRSSSSATRRRGSSAAANANAGPRIGADGKAAINCPRCSTAYKVPEEHLDSVVTCRNCKTAFTPRRASQGAKVNRRAAQSGGAGPTLLRIGLIASPFLIFLILWPYIKPAEKKAPPVKRDNMRILGAEHAPYQKLAALCKGVAAKQDIAIERVIAWPEYWAAQTKKNVNKWKLLSQDEKSAFQTKTIQAMYAGDLGEAFKVHDVSTIEHEAVPFPDDCQQLSVTLEFPHKENRNIGMATVIGDVRNGANGWLVHSWTATYYKERKRFKGPTRKKHKTIKAPKYETITLKGKKVKANQGEIVPVPHLESTPPELRKRIDGLIAQVFTQSDSPKSGILAAKELEEIGKPAIPRILHSFYERPIKSQFEREACGMLVKTYNNMVGSGVPWFFDTDPKSAFGASDEDRKKLVKALFGNWWFHYHKEGKNFQGETDEELDAAMEAGASSIDTGKKKRKASK